ncbi:hypothetical protein LTR09_008178 [Extremus antarcticus]|uniref:Uncharacterized protein n=1 Tax=Extremus antarcticus TaxID=702011 RepID=A0AAJ0DHZ4_9PEZI|nr:hypothetical protein LTR09_008178 [Extremus antarcticus]
MLGAVKPPHWFKRVRFDEKTYSDESDNDDEDAGLIHQRKSRSRKKEAEFVELSLRPMLHTAPDHITSEEAGQVPAWDCGRTVEEAMSRGCPFDVISNLWTPPRCYNSTFALEALQGVSVESDSGGVGAPEFGLGGFAWYEDEELSQPILSADDLEQFLAKRDAEGMPLEAYTHMSFHAAHCSYLARVATDGLNRLRNGERDVWVPEVAADPHHARHCEHVFGELYRLGEDGARRDKTGVGFGIAPCVQIG